MALTSSRALPREMPLPECAFDERARGRWRPAAPLRALVVAAVVFALAIVPRLADLGQYVTADEDLTLGRSASFARAVAARDWRRTYQIGHPEVTVAWLVTLGVGAEALRPYDDAIGPNDDRAVAARPGYLDVLVRARGVVAVAHAGLIALAALLVWRLWGATAGALAGIMLALEPFLVAHGRILRTDALLAELSLVAILAALAYWWRPDGRWALALCTVATGLALLTKTPAAILLAVVPIVALLRRDRPWWALGAWAVGAAAVYVAAWPAMWVRPLNTLERVIQYTEEKGGAPMDAGAFLLGSAAPDPGPLFYLVALAFRMTPILVVGLVAWLVVRSGDRRRAGLLLAVAGLFVAAMMVLPKKADRYVLPVVPLVATVAAVGLAQAVGRFRGRGAVLCCAAVLLSASIGLATVWPYPLSYYNPLLGGGRTAHAAMSVGWGEGLDQVARALNAAPDAAELTVATLYPEVLQAHFVGRVVPLDELDLADVAVAYVAATQRGLLPPPLVDAIEGRAPDDRVLLHGIPYAEVYRLARPAFGAGAPGDAQSGDGLPRDGLPRDGPTVGRVELRPAAVVRDRPVMVTLAWTRMPEPRSPLDAEVALLDEGGRVVRSTRAPLPERDGELVRYRLTAPSRWGKYTLAVALYDGEAGAYVPVARRPLGGPDVPNRLVFRSATVRVQ